MGPYPGHGLSEPIRQNPRINGHVEPTWRNPRGNGCLEPTCRNPRATGSLSPTWGNPCVHGLVEPTWRNPRVPGQRHLYTTGLAGRAAAQLDSPSSAGLSGEDLYLITLNYTLPRLTAKLWHRGTLVGLVAAASVAGKTKSGGKTTLSLIRACSLELSDCMPVDCADGVFKPSGIQLLALSANRHLLPLCMKFACPARVDGAPVRLASVVAR